MPRRQRSAGVVVFRDDDRGRVFLLLDYGRFWDYPKGHVEKGEDDASAALRELREETGIDDAALVPGFAKEIVYFFRAGKGLIRKEVVFFLARTARQRVKISDEHVGSAWLPFEAALERLTYPNARQILRDANAFLSGGFAPAPVTGQAVPSPAPASAPARAKVSRSRSVSQSQSQSRSRSRSRRKH